MLNSFRLRNLRGFSDRPDSPFVELKPLTVFVGKNSSGKSTCLRSLPLLRQSIEARTTGPILWYGSYVDFGAFSEALSHESKEQTIFFDFQLDIDLSNRQFLQRYYPWDYRFQDIFGKKSIEAQVELGVTESKNKTVAHSLKIQIENFTYELKFQNDDKCELTINGNIVKGLDSLNYLTLGHFLPEIGRIRQNERTIDGKKRIHRVWEEHYLRDFFTTALKSKISRFFHPNTSEETIYDGLKKIEVCDRDEIHKIFKLVFKSSSSFNKNFNVIEPEILEELYALTVHKSLPQILSSVDKELEYVFKNVRYIAPLRATAERYYRHQDLQVEEIDHTGSNLAMLLKSWSPSENTRFATWTMDNFGFKVRVNESGLHYALMIHTLGDEREYNINDMGFGFSQILPIVASIWLEILNSTRRSPRYTYQKQLIFAIEQPELHLHPEYQSKLATMFARVITVAQSQNISLKIIFETHSKTMIDTLGDNIEEGIIDKSDVNITLFEKCNDTNSSLVKFANFDKDGNLDNWPIGFFSGR